MPKVEGDTVNLEQRRIYFYISWSVEDIFITTLSGRAYHVTSLWSHPPRPSTPALRPFGAYNTKDKLQNRFLWPGMDEEFRAFCQQCHQCPQSGIQPLIVLPIISIIFKRIGMDLTGPLPKLVQGHRYLGHH